jgi:uncharacterized damage-inducible protein DinB
MNNEPSFLITDIDGYTPQVSRLLSMMNYARHTTLRAVEGLSIAQLDETHDEISNSIGALLLHFAAVETWYQKWTFEERDFTETEEEQWKAALNLGDEGSKHIRGHSIDYYLHTLAEVRDRTFALFKGVSDDWLYEEREFWQKKPANYYFMWFHVFEDEINHRGQIRWFRKRLQQQ